MSGDVGGPPEVQIEIGSSIDEEPEARSRGGRDPPSAAADWERPPADLVGGFAGFNNGSSIDEAQSRGGLGPLSGDAVWANLPAESAGGDFRPLLAEFSKGADMTRGAAFQRLGGAITWLRASHSEEEKEADGPYAVRGGEGGGAPL